MKIGRHAINLRWCNISISKNKCFEYQLEFGKKFASVKPGEFEIVRFTKRDHAGIRLTISVYKLFWLSLNIHDNRHWNKEKDCWEEH